MGFVTFVFIENIVFGEISITKKNQKSERVMGRLRIVFVWYDPTERKGEEEAKKMGSF